MAPQQDDQTVVPVVHDVLGTLFPPTAASEPLKQLLPTLSDHLAHAIVEDWFHSAQRDFTYLSMMGKYTPIGQLFKSTLTRVLVEKRVLSAQDATTFDTSTITDMLPRISPRPSFKTEHELLSKCDSVKFKLVAATNGATETTRSLLNNSLGSQESKKWDVFSCDEIQIAKPSNKVYETVWERLGLTNVENRRAYFVASHQWDCCAAKRAGFISVWTSYEEHLPLIEIWGQPDIVATDLEDAARQIIKREQERSK
ncbi:hypothetical protein OIO90_004661 [Microbotryomycetes sp. JL221]|nr:hypothetical protein OIO90_004661 [Microbotryomycetes sp. JL221]